MVVLEKITSIFIYNHLEQQHFHAIKNWRFSIYVLLFRYLMLDLEVITIKEIHGFCDTTIYEQIMKIMQIILCYIFF